MSVTTEDLGQIVEEVLSTFLPDLSPANPEDEQPSPVSAMICLALAIQPASGSPNLLSR